MLASGPRGYRMNASFKTADNVMFQARCWKSGSVRHPHWSDPTGCGETLSACSVAAQDVLGEAMIAWCETVPHGVLCFFPSYGARPNNASHCHSLCKRAKHLPVSRLTASLSVTMLSLSRPFRPAGARRAAVARHGPLAAPRTRVRQDHSLRAARVRGQRGAEQDPRALLRRSARVRRRCAVAPQRRGGPRPRRAPARRLPRQGALRFEPLSSSHLFSAALTGDDNT